MRDYRKLLIWQKGIEITKDVYRIIDYLPPEEKYGLRSQISRAAISIPSNIAEGCSRSSELEFKRFLEIALGSVFELETQIFLIKELGIIQESKLEDLFQLLHEEQKMINTLIGKLERNKG